MAIDLALHLDHLLRAAPEDQPALFRRVAALAWREGQDAGLDWVQTDPDTPNPYSAITEPGENNDH